MTPIRRNAMTVDVEDWFQVQAFANVIDRESWPRLEPRVVASTELVLERFARADVRGTFFTLGWVAGRQPHLIRRIVAAGHELASHGFGHERVHEIGVTAFRADIRQAKQVLEDVAGVPVAGYRAPTFSINTAQTPWAHEVLAEEGYSYSSSVFPIRHDLYGAADAPCLPHRPTANGVVELPMTTLRAFGRNFPVSGGGCFRLLPYSLFRSGLRRVNSTLGRSGIFYFHPWELDAGQPRVRDASLRSRLRHYTGIASMPRRIDQLLRDFSWDRMDVVHADVIGTQLVTA